MTLGTIAALPQLYAALALSNGFPVSAFVSFTVATASLPLGFIINSYGRPSSIVTLIGTGVGEGVTRLNLSQHHSYFSLSC